MKNKIKYIYKENNKEEKNFIIKFKLFLNPFILFLIN